MDVVLVHGFLNRGGIMKGIARGLERRGHRCHLPSLSPCDGRGGLARLAEQLSAVIRRQTHPEQPIAVIGFSMGALVARYYLQELEGHGRTRAFFSICGPHAGTRSARFYFSQAAVEMRPGSAFLRRLDDGACRLAGLAITSYWTPHDLMIRPVTSCQWPAGEIVRIPSLLHSLMPFNTELRDDIARRLEALGSA